MRRNRPPATIYHSGYTMKTLEDYNLVKDFLLSQGEFSPVAVVSVPESAWTDLVYLAKSCKRDQDEKEAERQAKLEGLSEEELGQMDREAEKAAKRDRIKALHHSCGTTNPE